MARAPADPEPTIATGALTALLREIAAAPEPEAPEPVAVAPGTVIGTFEVVRELGRGSFGTVYEAIGAGAHHVALKLIRPGKGRSGEGQLAREAEAIARLVHPNIVRLLDAGRCDRGPFLVFGLLHGRTLQERLAEGPVPLPEAVRIATDIARALEAAHGEGVVHRDLKPSNVMLCLDGPATILDFGMAHAFGRRRAAGGTPAYMAPEQWQDAPEDERTDVFALGVLLFRMFSGKLPFSDREDPWLDGPEPAPSLDIPASPALARLVARMLEKAPVRRPRDGARVVEALAPIAADLAAAPAALLASPVAVRHVARPSPRSAQPSVAVLPFVDLSPARDQEHVAEGVAEEILNTLARVRGLRVIGRASSFSFKGRGATVAEIGRELHVGAVLDGSVRRDGARVRINAHLTNATDETTLWSDSYDRTLAGVFDVQDEVARAVVDAMNLRLFATAGDEPRTAHADAYEHHLTGRQFLARGTIDGLRRAVTAFEDALEIDPAFAPAWAGLSHALAWLWRLGATRVPGFDDVEGRARTAAERAVKASPKFPGSLLARARVRLADWDWDRARSDVEEGLSLEPCAPWGLRLQAALLSVSGRREAAIDVTRRAIDADPRDALAWASLGWYQLDGGDARAARVALERALQIAPEFDAVAAMRALSFLVERRPAEALTAARDCGDERFRLMAIGLAEHDLGHRQEAQAALDALVARFGREVPYRVAEVHAWRGEADEAFEWLERAFAQHDFPLCDVRDDPLLRRLRSDERYVALLRRMFLPV
ncbi:MAG TPA: protein kinase [Anaeromyxobacteraceae bacterium]|nr:protein kinase [Anaeromyxobacteraceae bacterium]